MGGEDGGREGMRLRGELAETYEEELMGSE